jgi:hypothetical protein
LTKADVGKRVSVRVSGVLEGYLSTVTVSEPTVSVLAARVFVAKQVAQPYSLLAISAPLVRVCGRQTCFYDA